MSAAKSKAQGIIDDNAVGELTRRPQSLAVYANNQIAVFSKSYCPYCRATKALLTEMGAKYYAIELDQVGKLRVAVHFDRRAEADNLFS